MQDLVEHRWKTYDYPRYVHEMTHPWRLHTTATWFGLSPPEVATANVLELGCASGDNLICMAARLPNARFYGVDINEKAIEAGRALIAELGLTNIELDCRDILDVPLDGPPQGYVVVHGIYSWVPPDVQRRILDIARSRLSPDGIAYISYNALPGWRIWGVFREIMFERFGRVADPMEQAGLAQEFIRWMKLGQVEEDAWWNAVVTVERERMHMGGWHSVAHDQLSPMNQPLWIREFAKHASDAGLRFVSEASLPENWLMQRPAEVTDLLEGIQDPIERETMSDYIVGRTFRRTLLCHEERTPIRPRSPKGLLDRMFLTTALQAPEGVALGKGPLEGLLQAPGVEVTFKDPTGGREVSSDAPMLKAVLHAIATLDQPSVAELVAAAEAQLGEPLDEVEIGYLEATLWGWARLGLVELLTARAPRLNSVSKHPIAERLVRVCAERELPVVNVLHELLHSDDVDRTLLPRCDGAHDAFELARALDARISEGPLKGVVTDVPIPENVPDRLAVCASLVRGRLKRYAQQGLLVG